MGPELFPKKSKALPRAIILIIILILLGVVIYLLVATNKTNPTLSSSPFNPSGTSKINNSILRTMNNSKYGYYLTTPSNQTLYIYGPDGFNKSNCTGACLSLWPAYIDTTSAKGLPVDIGVLKRTDNNSLQYSYKGRPLYTYISDKPGQINGNGVGGFTIAKP